MNCPRRPCRWVRRALWRRVGGLGGWRSGCCKTQAPTGGPRCVHSHGQCVMQQPRVDRAGISCKNKRSSFWQAKQALHLRNCTCAQPCISPTNLAAHRPLPRPAPPCLAQELVPALAPNLSAPSSALRRETLRALCAFRQPDLLPLAGAEAAAAGPAPRQEAEALGQLLAIESRQLGVDSGRPAGGAEKTFQASCPWAPFSCGGSELHPFVLRGGVAQLGGLCWVGAVLRVGFALCSAHPLASLSCQPSSSGGRGSRPSCLPSCRLTPYSPGPSAPKQTSLSCPPACPLVHLSSPARLARFARCARSGCAGPGAESHRVPPPARVAAPCGGP